MSDRLADRYAVIGNPIAQSRSPQIHAGFAAATGQRLRYDALLAPLDAFAATCQAFFTAGGRGLNVTAPFKLEALALALSSAGASARARTAGAANALRQTPQGIEAENFDGIGLLRDLQQNLGCPLAGRRVLMLGAGGAARGALGPLLDAGPATLVLANRTLARAEAVFAELGHPAGLQPCALAALGGAGLDGFDVVIDATSASLAPPTVAATPAESAGGAAAPQPGATRPQAAADKHPAHAKTPPPNAVSAHDEGLALPAGCFAPDALAYTMVYGKGLTPFLAQAQAAGVRRLHDGVGMLVEQAAESFAWWRGIRPPTEQAIASLRRPLR